MKNLTLIGIIASLGIVTTVCEAGLFKNSVDLADLSEISLETLGDLRDSEFEVLVAQIGLNSAKAAERGAEGAAKAAGRMLETENLDLKAAKAEVQAAKANKDSERTRSAETLLSEAEIDHRTAKLFLQWKEGERAARRIDVKAAASRLDLAEAQRDLARAKLLLREGAPSALKYDAAEMQKSVSRRQKEFGEASRRAQAESLKVEALKLEWLQLAGHTAA